MSEGETVMVVRIELWPGGDPQQAQDLGTARIANVGTRTVDGVELADYRVELTKGRRYSRSGGTWKAGTVAGFPRRVLGPWDLLYRALRDLVGVRNEDEPREASDFRPQTSGADDPATPES